MEGRGRKGKEKDRDVDSCRLSEDVEKEKGMKEQYPRIKVVVLLSRLMFVFFLCFVFFFFTELCEGKEGCDIASKGAIRILASTLK